MTVKYQLLRDEFGGVYRPYRPTPDFGASVVTILVSVALVIFAVFIDRESHIHDVFAGLLVLAAIVLFVLAVWNPTFGTLIRLWQFSRRIGSGYQEHFADRDISFTFDEQKWSNGIATGPREFLWGELRIAAELENVVSLESDNGFVVVPKRALAPGQLSSLRKLAFGEFTATMIFRVGLREYLDTELPSLWRQHKSRMVGAHTGGLLLSAMMVWACWSVRGQRDSVWLAAMAGAMLIITGAAQFLYLLTAYVTQWRRVHVPWEAEFMERGAHVKTATTEHFSSWHAFTKFRETGRAFLLYTDYMDLDHIDPNRYYILPKTDLTPERQSALRNCLSSKLQSA
jgi:hypothetical protein